MRLSADPQSEAQTRNLLGRDGLILPEDDSLFGVCRTNFFQLRAHLQQLFGQLQTPDKDFSIQEPRNVGRDWEEYMKLFPEATRKHLKVVDPGLQVLFNELSETSPEEGFEILSTACQWRFCTPRFARFDKHSRAASRALCKIHTDFEHTASLQEPNEVLLLPTQAVPTEEFEGPIWSFGPLPPRHPAPLRAAFHIAKTREEAAEWLFMARYTRCEELHLGVRELTEHELTELQALRRGLGLSGSLQILPEIAFLEPELLQTVLPGASHPDLPSEFLELMLPHCLRTLRKMRIACTTSSTSFTGTAPCD